MARTIKIDNALKKRFAKQTNKRVPRELISYFLIVCEGEKTEPNYFKSFPKKVGKIIYDIEFEGGGISTMQRQVKLKPLSLMKKLLNLEISQCKNMIEFGLFSTEIVLQRMLSIVLS